MAKQPGKDLQAAIRAKGHDWQAGSTSISELPVAEQKSRLGLTVTKAELQATAKAIQAAAAMRALHALPAVPAAVDWRRIAWLSMGVLRTTPDLKRTMRSRFPRSRLATGEQVLCSDGKLRYFQPLRVAMYRKMLNWIRRGAPTVKIYLCMESKEVWQQVFGFAPSCEKELGNQMAPHS